MRSVSLLFCSISAPPADEEKAVEEVTEKLEELKVEDTKTEASTEEETTAKDKTTEE